MDALQAFAQTEIDIERYNERKHWRYTFAAAALPMFHVEGYLQPALCAASAVKVADALLAELDKEKEETKP